MALIFQKAAFTDAGLIKLFDLSGTFHLIRRTPAGNYIHLQSGHILVKIETAHLVILVG